MSIFWLQQTMADLPTDNSWLCANEALRLSGIKFPKRRNDWRLGRWTAKCAIAAYLGWCVESSFLDKIEIRPATSGAPEAFIADRRAALGISLSHCGGRAIAAVAPSEMAVGCDLERIEPRIDAFITDYFTPEEQLLIQLASASTKPALATLLWSAKESALKALCQGLRLDTRSLSVNVGDGQGISGYLAGGARWLVGKEFSTVPANLNRPAGVLSGFLPLRPIGHFMAGGKLPAILCGHSSQLPPWSHPFCSIHANSAGNKSPGKKNRARPPQGIVRVPFPRTIEN
jgi:4'-phosphopantetheinyl transferase